jgi:hypothetical protein
MVDRDAIEKAASKWRKSCSQGDASKKSDKHGKSEKAEIWVVAWDSSDLR